MLRIDHENYIKAGIEFVDGKFNLSTVVTHKTSDWSVITWISLSLIFGLKLSAGWMLLTSSIRLMTRLIR